MSMVTHQSPGGVDVALVEEAVPLGKSIAKVILKGRKIVKNNNKNTQDFIKTNFLVLMCKNIFNKI